MASSLPKPWIKSTASQVISNDSSTKFLCHRSRSVFVVRAFDDINCLQIHDRHHSIIVVLSRECIARYQSNNDGNSIQCLQNSIIKLESFYFSTVIQSLGENYDIAKRSGITFPITIYCDKISSLGAYDCAINDAPIDLNKEASIQAMLSNMTYMTLSERLGNKQFIGNGHMPNSNGAIPPMYSPDIPLKLLDCIIPDYDTYNFLFHCDGPIVQRIALTSAYNISDSNNDSSIKCGQNYVEDFNFDDKSSHLNVTHSVAPLNSPRAVRHLHNKHPELYVSESHLTDNLSKIDSSVQVYTSETLSSSNNNRDTNNPHLTSSDADKSSIVGVKLCQLSTSNEQNNLTSKKNKIQKKRKLCKSADR